MADLFKNKSIAMITLVVMFQWFVNTLTYYGLSFSAGELPGSGTLTIGDPVLVSVIDQTAYNMQHIRVTVIDAQTDKKTVQLFSTIVLVV